MNYDLPTSKTFLKTFYDSVVLPTYEGYDVNQLGIPSCGKSGLLKTLVWEKCTQTFRDNYPNFAPIFIDEAIYSTEQDIWNIFAAELKLPDGSSFAQVSKKTNELTRDSGKHVVIFLNQPQKWKLFNAQLSSKLFQLRRHFEEHVKFVFIMDAGITWENKELEAFLKILKIKYVYFPPYSETEVAYQVERNRFIQTEKTSKQTPKDVVKIFSLGGGIGGLSKKLSLLSQEDLSQTATAILKKHDHIKNEVEFIINNLNPEIISDLRAGKGSPELINIGLATKDMCPSSSLVKTYLSSISADKTLTVNESKIYKLLQESNGAVVSREDIAKAIWGENNWTDNYSEWAIDKLMSRLRSKIKKDIQTVKGQGYRI